MSLFVSYVFVVGVSFSRSSFGFGSNSVTSSVADMLTGNEEAQDRLERFQIGMILDVRYFMFVYIRTSRNFPVLGRCLGTSID